MHCIFSVGGQHCQAFKAAGGEGNALAGNANPDTHPKTHCSNSFDGSLRLSVLSGVLLVCKAFPATVRGRICHRAGWLPQQLTLRCSKRSVRSESSFSTRYTSWSRISVWL